MTHSIPPAAPPGPGTRRRLIRGVVPGLIAFSMGQTVIFAIAGPVFRDIGLTESQLGIMISSSALVLVLVSPIWGLITDRWGRKFSIVVGLSAYSGMGLAFAFLLEAGLDGTLAGSTLFVWLLLLRLLTSLFGAGIQPAAVALMADNSSAEDRSSAVAAVGAAFGVGMILGPASASLLVAVDVLLPLYLVASLGVAGGLVALLILPGHSTRARSRPRSRAALPLKSLAPLIASIFLLYLALSVIQQTLAFNVQDVLGTDSVATARTAGFLFLAIAVGMLVMQGFVIQYFKPSPTTLLALGVPAIFAGHLLYATADGYGMLGLALLLVGIGFGLTSPGVNAAASILTGADAQGRIAGALQSAMAAGYVIGPVLGTAVYEIERGFAAWIAFCASLGAVLIISVWLGLRRGALRAPRG